VLTVVHPPTEAGEAGGMEYPTLITTGGPWWLPPAAREPEIVTVHEFGHQWFYGLVATNELAWPFLDEGLNQAAEVDAMGKWLGDASAVEFAGLQVSDAALQGVSGNMGVQDEPVAQAASAFSTGADYSRLVYSRTASLLETLRRVYGDELVGRALGRYARRFRFRHPGPEDLFAVFEEVLGGRVAATMRTGLFGKGWVDYVVDGVYAERTKSPGGVFDQNGKREKREATPAGDGTWDSSVLVRRRGTLSFPVDVELVFADGSKRRERWDGEGESKRMQLHEPVALRAVVVDPDENVVIDANVFNNHGTTIEGSGGAPRTLERATYWMQLVLQAMSP
jgi:hypothetical protein